jgi:glucose-1-phosphate cytidylyltransferase
MKVVLFCGGLGMRLKEFSESIPKPLVTIGLRPLLWHVMKYYAHFGHKDFILCLGYRADLIKDYFLKYDECLSNDFILSGDGSGVQLLDRDIHDWKITFVDTGLNANVGQRLRAVEKHLAGEEVFLANYADGLTDFPLPRLIEHFQTSGSVASFLGVRPSQTFHVVSTGDDDRVTAIQDVKGAGLWINGGFFVMHRSIFDYIGPGEELIQEPFQRLIEERKLSTHRYGGFFLSMDTFKDKQLLDELYSRGNAPWEVWKTPGR